MEDFYEQTPRISSVLFLGVEAMVLYVDADGCTSYNKNTFLRQKAKHSKNKNME